MSNQTLPPAARPPSQPQLPLGVLLGLGALLLIGGVLIGGLVAVVVMRSPGQLVAAQPSVTPLPLATQPVTIPTVTPAPTSTDTPEPTATKDAATKAPEPTKTEAEATATEVIDFLTVDVGANVRSGPGVTYPVVANLAAGDTATVVGKDTSGTWFAIETTRTSSGQAWIAGLVATFEGDTASLPIVAAPPPPAVPPTTSAPAAPPPSGGGGPVTGQRGITGQLTLCNARTTYGTNERICFVESIRNTTSAPVSYGILGVQASSLSGGSGQFQTSWNGDLAPGGVLWIDPGCEGPTDRCKGSWEDGMTIRNPGTYRLVLSVCFSDFNTCLGTSGAWETLSQPIVVSVQ
jgi:hypothetical protein